MDTEQPAFAEIPEADATGRTREIYDEFRASIGLPMVNLIYRHMATTPGCLEWAWAHLRPHFVSGAIAREADRLVADLDSAPPSPVTREALREAGVDAAAERIITGTIEAYNRANPMNLIAMAVLARELEFPVPDGLVMPPNTRSIRRIRQSTALPPLADPGALSERTRAVLGVLASQAGVGGTAVVPTLYRHLTSWPGFLDIVASALTPVADGGLDRATAILQEGARGAARRLPRYAIGLPAPSGDQRKNLIGLIDLFPVAISRMIIIGVFLRKAMPD